MIKYAIISGSTRQNSQSAKVAGYLLKALVGTVDNCEVVTIDLSEANLPN